MSRPDTAKLTKSVNGVTASFTTETSYDAMSRVKSIKYPDDETVNYTYDSAGNLWQVGSYAAYTNYTALGQPRRVDYGNGASTDYVYNTANNRLSSIVTNSQGQARQNLAYYYDNVGNIESVMDNLASSRTQTFGYDHLHRLTSALIGALPGPITTITYTYNEIGN